MNQAIEDLKKLRTEQALTAREISVALKTSERNVWRWLNNNNTPSPEAVKSIRKFVDTSRALLVEADKRTTEKYEKAVLDAVYDGENGFFHPIIKAGERVQSAVVPDGVAVKDVWYEYLKQKCEILGSDELLLTALDSLASNGAIKIIQLWVPPRHPAKMGEGFVFKLEIGTAFRSQAGQNTQFEIVRSYRNTNLEVHELPPGTVRNPKEIIERIRKGRAESARMKYGDQAIRTDLHHEEIVDESAQRQAQLQLVDILKGDKKMANDPQGSEFDTLPAERVRTKKIIEIKRLNNSKAPMVFYQHDGSRLTIEPGCAGIQTKLVHIKPLAVEKKK